MGEETITRICFCQHRIDAMAAGDFKWSAHFGGWHFPDLTRSMSNRTYEAVYFDRKDCDHENHAGEPYIYTECPWCGAFLPGARTDQADGQEGYR